MGEIIDIDAQKPHTEGPARCLLCGHTWRAVCPSGVIFFECPQCETMHGTFHYTVLNDAAHWHCQCGGSLFHITQKGVYCPICGGYQDFGKSVA
jgi:hypothetical protein